ncbi:MAG: hypothetical protein LBR93_08095 [Treponema sp.]|jgi:hypothetical protein|nr:hypothetical protein [Treponema sp.]
MKPLAFSLVIFLFFSCASAPFARVDGKVEESDYAGSVTLLEKEKKSLYTGRDNILYYLDKGMLAHYAGLYTDSSDLLESGERAIEAAFTKSITQEISTYLVNDTTRDYDGEDYEDIYINAFNALNYYHRGELEDAMVEIRRMSNKLQNLSVKYGAILTNLQKKALEEEAAVPPDENAPSQFSDSALARYIGMLFYRGSGRWDDARIDRDRLRVAFANAPEVYPYPEPSSLGEDLSIPGGMARLNVIAFGGLSPTKEEETLRIPIPPARYIKIALPKMVSRPSEVERIEVALDGGERFTLELLENIEAVARETYKKKERLIYLKTIIRATVKGATSSVLEAAAADQEGGTGLLLGVLSLGAQVYAEASEKADLRISRYFPGKAYVGGINLEPGVYSFSVTYYGQSERPLAVFRYEDVPVKENSLNLTEAVCLR